MLSASCSSRTRHPSSETFGRRKSPFRVPNVSLEAGEDRMTARVLQMRLVVEASDYDEAVAFYRDVLGADTELTVDGDAGERVTILQVGRATLEISNPEQVEMIDRVEV